MKKGIGICLLLIAAMLSACAPGKLFGPTLTPTATNTATPTSTPPPTATRTPTPLPTCQAKPGNWKSSESSGAFGTSSPMLTFTVRNCAITAWEIWTFPAPGELLWWPGTSSIPILAEAFSQAEDTGMGVFIFEGVFDSPTTSHGILKFPAGFSVFGTILPADVTITWNASP